MRNLPQIFGIGFSLCVWATCLSKHQFLILMGKVEGDRKEVAIGNLKEVVDITNIHCRISIL